MKPKALDLFCGAGGATRGLQRAGFHVTGVDIKPQPRYVGDAFHQADALTFPLAGFDLIWASPPCQAYSSIAKQNRGRNPGAYDHPDLVAITRERLTASVTPWIIENVIGAPLISPGLLCGSMFGLNLRRHRLFEASFAVLWPQCVHHHQGPRFRSLDKRRAGSLARVVGVHGHLNYAGEGALRAQAMGIEWMSDYELTQAIPPAYSEHIGRYALMALRPQAVAS